MKALKSLLRFPWYPLLIASAPVISLFVINRIELHILDLVRPLLVSLAFAGLAWCLSGILVRGGKKSALAACLLIICVFIYDYAFLALLPLLGDDIESKTFLGSWLFVTALLFGLAVWKLRISQRSFNDFTILLNSFGFALVLFAILPAIAGGLQWDNTPSKDSITQPMPGTIDHLWKRAAQSNWAEITRPDIYYILVDAYARQDVLDSHFRYDNSPFLSWLRSKGFFVGDQSHANYPSTHLSLAATLNAEYLQTLLPESLLNQAPIEPRARTQYLVGTIAGQYIRRSRVHKLLDAAGYRFLSNDSGYTVTKKNPTSLGEALTGEITEFERALLEPTVIYPLLASSTEAIPFAMTMHESLLRAFDELASIKPHSSPSFVFYHLMSPHAPFSFREDGSQALRHPVYDASAWVEDRNKLEGYHEYYRQNYPKNVAGLNRHLKKAIKSILENTDHNAVIILQSDHGSSLGLVPGSTQNTDIPERFGILNAIYLPGDIPSTGLTAEMSSINTFPIILNALFGLNFPILKNRAFLPGKNLEFEEVTSQLEIQPANGTRVEEVGAGR